MNKRVYGVIGIASRMANWNADFSGYPKTTSDGETFGSDKALKYPMKKMWENNGEKVLYIKSMKFIGAEHILAKRGKNKEVTLVPRSLKERYEQIFNIDDLKTCKDSKVILENLFKAIDVKNFGATFAESDNNISITGAVQIGQGFNKYDGTNPEEQQILSPFRDGSKDNAKGDSDEAKSSTLGTKIVSNEAHYFYPFTINPLTYNGYKELGVTEGYTEEDYNKFKKAALVSATSFATNSKVGCENEFALFVETDEDLYLPNLSEYVSFSKEENIDIIKIECSELLNKLENKIKKVEIYYNSYKVNVEHDIKGAKVFNIFTQEEV